MFEQDVEAALVSRKLGCTALGHPTLLPVKVRRGDRMCILYPWKSPIILRPCDGHYTFVGECCFSEFADVFANYRAHRLLAVMTISDLKAMSLA